MVVRLSCVSETLAAYRKGKHVGRYAQGACYTKSRAVGCRVSSAVYRGGDNEIN